MTPCAICPCPDRCRREPAFCALVATDREGALWRKHVCADPVRHPPPGSASLPTPEEADRIIAELERMMAAYPPRPAGRCCG